MGLSRAPWTGWWAGGQKRLCSRPFSLWSCRGTAEEASGWARPESAALLSHGQDWAGALRAAPQEEPWCQQQHQGPGGPGRTRASGWVGTHTHLYTQGQTHTHRYTCTHTNTHVHTSTQIYLHMHRDTHEHTDTQRDTRTQTHTPIYTRTDTHTQIHTCTHTDTHIAHAYTDIHT